MNVPRVDVDEDRRARPCSAIADTVATNVNGTVITSSPGPTPAARSARCSALVPLLTPSRCCGAAVGRELALEGRHLAAERELARLQHAARWPARPPSLIARYCAFRSTNGNHVDLPWRLDVDGLAPSAHRAGGGLDQLDDAQAEMAVGLGWLAVLDAVDEVLAGDAERLGRVQLRRPHVARPVADAHLVDLLGVVGEADALVVDLDLLARLQVVVGDHLLAAADQDLPDLHRREPADVDVRDDAGVVEERDVGEVLRRARGNG